MRFKQYLNEKELSKEEILALIEKGCKPFLRDWRKLKIDKFLLSGRDDNDFFAKKQVRKDRKPMDTPLHSHKLMDDWFHEKFGVRSRSNAVFCSFNKEIASFYGYAFLIFPIGNYKAVSSKTIGDLYSLIYADASAIRKKKYSEEELQQEIIKAMGKGQYTNKLSYHMNEIMVTCKEYYMVGYSLTDYLLENLKG